MRPRLDKHNRLTKASLVFIEASLVSGGETMSKLRMTVAMTTRRTTWARFCPPQRRLPAPNGIRCWCIKDSWDELVWDSSQRSGRNVSGEGKMTLSR